MALQRLDPPTDTAPTTDRAMLGTERSVFFGRKKAGRMAGKASGRCFFICVHGEQFSSVVAETQEISMGPMADLERN